MKYLFKALLLAFMMATFAIKGGIPYTAILLLLLIAAVNLFRERFYPRVSITILSFLLICVGIRLDKNFSFLLAIPTFDFIYQKKYLGLIAVLTAGFYSFFEPRLPILFLLLAISGILASLAEKAATKETHYQNRLDDERRLRYELEQAKAKLLHSSRDITHLTEVRERNRIAREIHDNVGHRIAGILIQLQAALKLFSRDEAKSKEILQKSIAGLSQSLTLLRDTVHNIKPQETLGVDYIQRIINDFGFCPVDFKFHGSFNQVPANHLEIIGANIKEALTNVSRHSKATNIEIVIDINDRFTRLYIKDNGAGCEKLVEGLGLSGMKERVLNMGGTISISSHGGFMIVCLLPKEGGGLFENTYSG